MSTSTILSLGNATVNLGFSLRKRGDRVQTASGSTGTFIGRKDGVDWIAYDETVGVPSVGKFILMCHAFDGTVPVPAGWDLID